MVRADVVTLLSEFPGAHGVFDAPLYNYRTVYCEVKSVSQAEAYQARATGLIPEYRLVLTHSFEYQGEKLCDFRGSRYEIIRTYMTESDGIELTIQRVLGNAAVEESAHV
jgi:SPP1 family predicted phage head-tail adaptor